MINIDNASHSLRGRLLGAMLAIFVFGVGAALLFYRSEAREVVQHLRERTLQAQASALKAAMHIYSDGFVEVNLPLNWRRAYNDPSQAFSYTLFDSSHRPIAWSSNLLSPLPYRAVKSSKSLGPVEFVGAGSQREAVLSASIPKGYLLVVARRRMNRGALVDSLLGEMSEHLILFVPFVLITLALLWSVSGWSLRPLSRASRQAAAVGPSNPDTRISVQGLPRELRPLVDAVNGALDRLSGAYEAERRLTANAAHELRTPLAVLTLRLQRARATGDNNWPAVERELGHMRRLVDQLTDLAQQEFLARGGEPGKHSRANLSRVVREVAATVLPLFEKSGRQLDVDVPETMYLNGRADDFKSVIRNLLDNALTHGRGKVTLKGYRLAAPQPTDPGSMIIKVCDEGEGVPAGQEDAVFERFAKLRTSHSGSGLGLAIVRQIIENNGGSVSFVPGRGCVVVRLPEGEPINVANDRPLPRASKETNLRKPERLF